MEKIKWGSNKNNYNNKKAKNEPIWSYMELKNTLQIQNLKLKLQNVSLINVIRTPINNRTIAKTLILLIFFSF